MREPGAAQRYANCKLLTNIGDSCVTVAGGKRISMRGKVRIAITLTLAGPAMSGWGMPALANAIVNGERTDGSAISRLPPYLQCVPYARQVSGIRITGDAWTWWTQAEGRYARGQKPRVGAVMAFRPHGNMELGHVAAVSRVVDSRTVLLRHANWSPINGRRGQIEDDVAAVDVSPDNDWSAVRVWFDPIRNLGATHWPVSGFIYPQAVKAKPAKPARMQLAIAGGDDPIGMIIAARLADGR